MTETTPSCWVIEEQEAEAVRQIFAWYTGEEKLTIWEITTRLNQSYQQAVRRAKIWQYSVVRKILQRTAYIGYTHFNKERIQPEIVGTPRITGRGKRRTIQTKLRREEEWIKVKVPALVDETMWYTPKFGMCPKSYQCSRET